VKAAIHRNHGLLTASRHSIESAAFWFIALERCCRQQLMIEATGRPPVLVPPERARYSREHVGFCCGLPGPVECHSDLRSCPHVTLAVRVSAVRVRRS
jgi:hypothetical protein